MMRILATTPYRRRVRKSKRGIIIACVLTVAAFVLTIGALMKGAHVDDSQTPVAIESPVFE